MSDWVTRLNTKTNTVANASNIVALVTKTSLAVQQLTK